VAREHWHHVTFVPLRLLPGQEAHRLTYLVSVTTVYFHEYYILSQGHAEEHMLPAAPRAAPHSSPDIPTRPPVYSASRPLDNPRGLRLPPSILPPSTHTGHCAHKREKTLHRCCFRPRHLTRPPPPPPCC